MAGRAAGVVEVVRPRRGQCRRHPRWRRRLPPTGPCPLRGLVHVCVDELADPREARHTGRLEA